MDKTHKETVENSYKNGKYANYRTGVYRIWKLKPWGLYRVEVCYFLPLRAVPLAAFPATAILFSQSDYDYEALGRKLCRQGQVIMLVKPPGAKFTSSLQQAEDFLQAVWQTLAYKIRGQVASPPELSWWSEPTAWPVLELAASLKNHRYYMRPDESGMINA